MNFEGKIILVTGAASGIGAATSNCFLAGGGTVIGVDKNEMGLKEMSAASRPGFTAICCDLSNEHEVVNTASIVQKCFGRIDVLVNNAGVAKFVGTDFTCEDFDMHFHINLRGPMLMIKHFVELLRASEAPVVVNISSLAARMEWGNHFLYSCAKAGIEKYTKHLVRDLPWLRSNCVLPGVVDTSILDGLSTPEQKDALFKVAEETIPCGRVGRAKDVANAVMFLSSAEAEYINGASLVVDGGLLHNNKWLGI